MSMMKGYKIISLLSLWVMTMIYDGCNGLTYNYFAYGSNMYSSTMKNLRNLNPLGSSAALLVDHKLRFNIPGAKFIEPSSASVEPISNDETSSVYNVGRVVHGVLYSLSEDDFAAVCRTEGVPFAYSLHRCEVLPYKGDGKDAGCKQFEKLLANNGDTEVGSLNMYPAFTLRAARNEWRLGKDTPPSQSYLNVMIKGAEEFQLDSDYVNMLRSIKNDKFVLGGGAAESMLQLAELNRSYGRRRQQQ